MKVLWLSVTPSLFKEGIIGGWIGSLELVVKQYLSDNIELGVLFETTDNTDFRILKNGTTYYPISGKTKLEDLISRKISVRYYWDSIMPKILDVIEDFKPDIVHCFGSEWPYGLITEYIKVPVVIHMQGFLNIYNESSDFAISIRDKTLIYWYSPKRILASLIRERYKKEQNNIEKKVMKLNRYYMGRTDWDRDIVKYFSPNSKYYHVEEAIRPNIYEADSHRCFIKNNDRLRLITITQAGELKGNEVVLRTARILKSFLGDAFEWRIAGRIESFRLFEKKTGISSKDVNIVLLGMIDSQHVTEELQTADFYVHPSIIDNSPNSLCEAQLIGCPVIASNAGGIPQLVEDGITGFLFPYNEPYKLAFLIMSLRLNTDLLNEVSGNEIRVSHNRHNPQKIAETLIRTYKEIIDDYRSKT